MILAGFPPLLAEEDRYGPLSSRERARMRGRHPAFTERGANHG
jgi:hypothetical protein